MFQEMYCILEGQRNLSFPSCPHFSLQQTCAVCQLCVSPVPGAGNEAARTLRGTQCCWWYDQMNWVSTDRLYELQKTLLLFQISKPSAFIMCIYALLSLYVVKTIKYYLINLPDTSKILSYTDHNNCSVTEALLPQD